MFILAFQSHCSLVSFIVVILMHSLTVDCFELVADDRYHALDCVSAITGPIRPMSQSI
jgi:hypothetical protein